MRYIIKLSATACLAMFLLQGCAPLILGAVGVGAAISTDRRPALLQSNDKGLHLIKIPKQQFKPVTWRTRILQRFTMKFR